MKALMLLVLVTLAIALPLIKAYTVYAQQNIDEVKIVVGYTDDIAKFKAVDAVGGFLKELREIKALVFSLPRSIVDVVIEKLKKIPGIRYVELDAEVKALEVSDSLDIQWNIKIINVTKVWDTYYSNYTNAVFGKGVIVAVLDTGVDYTHPDLKGRVTYCVNTVGVKLYKGTNLKNCLDKNGHGTHVTGVVAATINNVGVAGIVPNVSIMAVQVLSASGSGTASDVAEGIVEAVKAGAKILSMSLGSTSESSVIRDATLWAYQQGAVQIVAAGNSGDGDPSTNNVNYPARYSWVIAVAAVDESYNIPSWSSDGLEVDIAAPGVNILSTYLRSGYAYASGTSMATPHVTGVIALIQALRIASGLKPLNFTEIYNIITKTAVDVGPEGFDVFSGYGVIDAYKSVKEALTAYP